MAIQMHEPMITTEPVARRARLPQWLTWQSLRRLPLVPLLIIAVFVFISIFGDWLAPHPYNAQNLRLRFLPPAWLEGGNPLHLLGTDNLGRDMLSRIIVGAQASFIVAISALAFGSVMGCLIGLTWGY